MTTPPLRHWPGTGEPQLLAAHATGFCKEVWGPFVTALRAAGCEVPVRALDFGSHGAAAKLAHPIRWADFGNEVAEARQALAGRVAGIGHSMGGAALLLHALAEPSAFEQLILIEPIVFPPALERQFADVHPLADVAARRRRTFASPEAALSNFAAKPVFAGWTNAALEAYVSGGLVREGDHFALACEPADEAATFRGAIGTGLWDRLPEVVAPVTIVVGESSDSHPPAFADLLASRFEEVSVAIVPGAGHFVPMEQPDALAEIVTAALRRGFPLSESNP